jgi:hypothetical protein
MKKRFGAPSPALVVAMAALFVALGGTSYAAVTLANNSVGTAQLKNGAVTAQKINKSAWVSPVTYAHVARDGTVDAKQSSGITGSMVHLRNDSAFCFSKLPFKPKSGVVSIDFGGADNGNTELAQIEIKSSGTATDCNAGEHVEVATSLGSGTYSPEPFYVVLYG